MKEGTENIAGYFLYAFSTKALKLLPRRLIVFLRHLALGAGLWVIGVNSIFGQATISGTITVCQNASSPNLTLNANGGTSPYTFSYTINGIPQVPLIGIPPLTVSAPTNIIGVFNYLLSNVVDNVGNIIPVDPLQSQATITVIAPTPLSGGHDVNSVSACSGYNPNITLSINSPSLSGGLAPYAYRWQLNGIDIPSENNATYAPPVLIDCRLLAPHSPHAATGNRFWWWD